MSNQTAEQGVRNIAKAIAAEYRRDAARWTQGTWARDKDGDAVSARDENAVCWCLRGAIEKHITFEPYVTEEDCYFAFDLALGFDHAKTPSDDEYHFVYWNDRPQRKVQEVIALCDEVANG